MAYNNYNLQQLKDLVKQRFYRKNAEREARGVKYNKSKAFYQNLLQETDKTPILSNKAFEQRKIQNANIAKWNEQRQQRIRQEETRQRIGEMIKQNKINKLRNSLSMSPISSFNQLEELNYKFTEEDINRIFRNIKGKYTTILKLNDGRTVEITITPENINRLKKLIIDREIIENITEHGSDKLKEYEHTLITHIKLQQYQQPRNVRRQNAFFAYFNKTDIPLSQYQIYTTEEDRVAENECCLLFALRKGGISEVAIIDIIAKMGALQTNIPLSKMEEIANIINHKIIMYYYDEKKEEALKKVYGKEFTKEVTICQYVNHFFVYEETKYTKFYIANKQELDDHYGDDEKRFIITKRNKSYFESISPKLLNSLWLIVNMMKNNHFSEYHIDLTNKACENYVIQPSLHSITRNQELNTIKEKKSFNGDRDTIYLFADCESDVVTFENHKMIAFAYMDMQGNYNQFVCGQDIHKFKDEIGNSLMKYKDNNIVMFFHNMKYDSTLFNDLFYSSGEVSKDGQVYSKTYYFAYGLRVEFRDSLKHFGGKLKDAAATFGLGESKGEAIAYTYHTINNICVENDRVSTQLYSSHLTEEDKKVFFENVDHKTHFNANKYYLDYLRQDVNVLRQSMIKYRELIRDITGLDAFEYLTISSIGYKYAEAKGCFEGLYRVKGCLREFIQRSIKGGRVFVNPEYKNKEINENIEDFDGVSLYPSSMKRLCEEYGLPKGQIKLGEEQSYLYYESKDWYIVKINITKINKSIQIPCVSHTSKDGNIEYLNEITEPLTAYVDKTTLNDYIRFQDIEYTIEEGIYWDEGFNKGLGELILHLHNQRCLYKSSNKPLATMIKLIMNSIYGKTGQRIGEIKTVFISNDKKDKYIYDHFGTVAEIESTQFNTKITQRICDNGFSLNYVAGSILSMSKRIMNEVFSVMEENKQPVYYTDTDSIHMLQKDVATLGESYKTKYNRELIGKNLGQFHTDFDMDGASGVFSIKHIPIGTKTYLDVLQGKDNDGNIIQDTHIRIKGITKAGIEHELARRGENRIDSAIGLFRDLKNGVKVEFLLNPTDHNVSFEFTSKGVSTRKTGSFTRTLN